MNPEERDRLAERWLDATMRHYAEAEPRPGMETRLLANLREARPEGARLRWLRIALPLAAAAAVVMVVGVSLHRGRTATPATLVQPTKPATVPAPAMSEPASAEAPARASGPAHGHAPARFADRVAQVRSSHRKPIGDSQTATASAPRLEQFPTPTPLSEQEQMLMRYLQQTPREEVATVVRQDQEFRKEHQRERETPPLAPAP